MTHAFGLIPGERGPNGYGTRRADEKRIKDAVDRTFD
jgi:hypothetical protein